MDNEAKEVQGVGAKVGKEEKKKVVKRLLNEYNRTIENKKKMSNLNNNLSDVKEFDTEKSFIQKFISDEHSKTIARDMKKKRAAKKLQTLNMAPVSIIAY